MLLQGFKWVEGINTSELDKKLTGTEIRWYDVGMGTHYVQADSGRRQVRTSSRIGYCVWRRLHRYVADANMTGKFNRKLDLRIGRKVGE